ncbi:E3 ubiquitin-protein ligase RMA1H1-like [Andrographis paniculata]|uniref:E3 ubiquitin-protein ligase RMA1H1-like n=1 Tax=Andrographis paniculata TaxID=175694 RepID=UPI0021E82934|nr:E3 ubiquitin-protein ligase RMA1H1-like [Andrographis paniculata]XP_051136244.1 E3 ubiquitin-protein ligase RMA1H1-like [Andrographis paniculata]XP_051136245.1 E3 ubiquitin-protein ligase RMA1H1-like [Andrographis paniculata]
MPFQQREARGAHLETLKECFDCNICLDSCLDPVVTLCGHLYCWPCIYKWLHVQTTSASFESEDDRPKCPVCKAYISTSSLVPLYGRGQEHGSEVKKPPQLDLTIPNRPSPLSVDSLLATNNNNLSSFQPESPGFRPQHYISHPFNNQGLIAPPSPSAASSSFSPTINMVSEMVFAGMFGSSDTSLFAYPYQNSYHFLGRSSPRLRRQEMQLDKSLNRVSIFLFCCIALCLILF